MYLARLLAQEIDIGLLLEPLTTMECLFERPGEGIGVYH